MKLPIKNCFPPADTERRSPRATEVTIKHSIANEPLSSLYFAVDFTAESEFRKAAHGLLSNQAHAPFQQIKSGNEHSENTQSLSRNLRRAATAFFSEVPREATCLHGMHPLQSIAGAKKHLILFFVIICLFGSFTSESFCQNRESARISILIGTGMPGGTYYHVGLGMASLWTTKLRDAGIRVSAAMSEGSMENIEAIRIADADLILVEDLFCSMAVTGSGVFKGQPVPELRSITALWPDVLHLLVRSDKMRTGTLHDLDGLSLATGLPDSGNRFITELLLRSLKAGRPKPRLRPMSNLAAAEALRKGLADGIDFTGGVPIPLVAQLLNEGKPPLGFLEISEAQMDSVREEGWKNVFRFTIPGGSYLGQEKPVNTLAHINILAVTASLNPEVVYALTKTFYENLDYLVRVHPTCKSISLEKALDGLNVPLHKGALRYYRERKVKIPDHLIH